MPGRSPEGNALVADRVHDERRGGLDGQAGQAAASERCTAGQRWCRHPRIRHACWRASRRGWPRTRSPSPWTVGGSAAPTSGRLCPQGQSEQGGGRPGPRVGPDFGTGHEPVVSVATDRLSAGMPRRARRAVGIGQGCPIGLHGPTVGAAAAAKLPATPLVLKGQVITRRVGGHLARPSGRRRRLAGRSRRPPRAAAPMPRSGQRHSWPAPSSSAQLPSRSSPMRR